MKKILLILFCLPIIVFGQQPCGLDSVEITITITTDNYPLETSFGLIDQNGGGWAIPAGDLTQANYTYIFSVCAFDANCYTFTIEDTGGDGICCSYGTGSYDVSYAGTTVAIGGSFALSDITTNIGSCGSTPGWDCDGQGNCNYNSTQGTYSTYSACLSACSIVTPSWDCDGQGNCYDPGNGFGQYSNLSQCQSSCVIPASWDCTGSISGGCSDPGDGTGSYSSLAACLPNCPADVTWDCDGQGNCSDPGTGFGLYFSLSDCQMSCILPTWDCIGVTCYDPWTGQGAYASLSDCETSCILPTWDCVAGSSCIDPGTGTGQYASLASCQVSCGSSTASWDCGSTGCYDPGTGSGQYTSLASCQAICGTSTPSWDCGSTGCYDPGTGSGQYTSLTMCQNNCNISSWQCNGAGTCYDPGNGSGAYTSLSECEDNCIIPETWSCDPLTGLCEEFSDGTGNYTDYGLCESSCDLQLGVENRDIEQLMIFPNPTDQIINIHFLTIVKQSIKIRLISTIGEIIFVENLENYSGEYSKKINLKEYSKGIYFLQIETHEGTTNNKIIRY